MLGLGYVGLPLVREFASAGLKVVGGLTKRCCDVAVKLYAQAIDTMEALNEQKKSLKGSKVLVLGLAYKKDIDDLRESPSIELIELLLEKGAKVDYNDPYIPRTHKQRQHDLRMQSRKLSAKMLAGYDVVLISTDHSDYDYEWIVENSRFVVDTRNATKGVRKGRKKIVKA